MDKVYLTETYKLHYCKNSEGHFLFFGFRFFCPKIFSREERAGKADASSEAGRLAWSAVDAAAVVAHLQKTELHQKRAQTPSPICVEGAQVMTAAQKRSSSTSCHMSPTRMLALSLNCYKLTPATTTTETETVGNSCKTTTMLYSNNAFSTYALWIFGTFMMTWKDLEGIYFW